MSFLIPHPEGYTFASPADLPEDFAVKCYQLALDEWEVTYDLPNQSVKGLYRYTKFSTFEEAAVRCSVLGLKCIKCKWLMLPPKKGEDGKWYRSILSLPHFGAVLVPIDKYDSEKARIYKEKLGSDYDEYVMANPGFLAPLDNGGSFTAPIEGSSR